MTSSDSDDDGRGALGARLRGDTVPPALETRVLDTLQHRGLLAPRPRRMAVWRIAAGIGAIAMAFGGGTIVGARRAPAAVSPTTISPRFLLLLYRDSAAVAPRSAVDDTVAAEYGRWARALARDGRAVSGEELGDRAVAIDSATASRDGQQLVGFFIVSAASLDDATAVARSCPHLRRGGTIVVRDIVRS